MSDGYTWNLQYYTFFPWVLIIGDSWPCCSCVLSRLILMAVILVVCTRRVTCLFFSSLGRQFFTSVIFGDFTSILIVFVCCRYSVIDLSTAGCCALAFYLKTDAFVVDCLLCACAVVFLDCFCECSCYFYVCFMIFSFLFLFFVFALRVLIESRRSFSGASGICYFFLICLLRSVFACYRAAPCEFGSCSKFVWSRAWCSFLTSATMSFVLYYVSFFRFVQALS